MPYAFSRTISAVLCTFKRFHNFIFHQSARWVYLGPGVKVGSLLWSARKRIAGLEGNMQRFFYLVTDSGMGEITVPDRGGRISSCGLAARRLSWDVMVRVWNGNQRGR